MRPTNASVYVADLIRNGRLTKLKVIDVHTHMDSIYGVSSPICNAADCMKLLDEENISQIWCATHGDLFGPDAFEVNRSTKALVHAYPDRVKGYFVYNPNHADRYLPLIGEALSDPGFIGYKVLPNYHNTALDSEAYEPMLAYAEEHRLVVLSHTWGVLPHNSPREVANVMARHPHLIFIMGHSAPGECEAAIALAKKYEGLYLDLCDIHRHSGIVARMVNSVGSEKVLFGTDLPWYDPIYAIGSVLCAHIGDADRENIFYKNAESILQRIKR